MSVYSFFHPFFLFSLSFFFFFTVNRNGVHTIKKAKNKKNKKKQKENKIRMVRSELLPPSFPPTPSLCLGLMLCLAIIS